MEKYIILEKEVGETPLSCAEEYRAKHPELKGVSMAYAGRLDPMASGKLLILLGEECKNQTAYHGLDKEYEFSVLLGIESDSLDVLGRLGTPNKNLSKDDKESVTSTSGRLEAKPKYQEEFVTDSSVTLAAQYFIGLINQPYPRFSSKTVQGKPLHTWTMEGRLGEIEIPTKESTVYKLELTKTETLSKETVVKQALEKVNSIPPVTELRKALGNDFRRVDIRQDWNNILYNDSLPDTYQIAHFKCIASSGTYMRTLASELAKKLDTVGLAWSIHRSIIGTFDSDSETWTISY
jgi:tRNA pseudouridine55 synthase